MRAIDISTRYIRRFFRVCLSYASRIPARIPRLPAIDMCLYTRYAFFWVVMAGVSLGVLFTTYSAGILAALNGALLGLGGVLLFCVALGKLALRPLPFIFPSLIAFLVLGLLSFVYNGLWIDGALGDLFTPTTLPALVLFTIIAAIGGGFSLSVETLYRGIIIGVFISAFFLSALWWNTLTESAEEFLFASPFVAIGIFLSIGILWFLGNRVRIPLFWAATITCYGGALWIALFSDLPSVVITTVLLVTLCAFLWEKQRYVFKHTAVLLMLMVSISLLGVFANASFFDGRIASPVFVAPHVIHASFTDSSSAIFGGNGPGSIPYAWNTFRTPKVNNSHFWDAMPHTTGVGIFDVLLTFGILGGTLIILMGTVSLCLLGRSLRQKLDASSSPRAAVEVVTLLVCITGTAFVLFGPFYTSIAVLALITGCIWFSMNKKHSAGTSILAPAQDGGIYPFHVSGLIVGAILIITGFGYGLSTSMTHTAFANTAYTSLSAFPHDDGARRVSLQYLEKFLAGNPAFTPTESKMQLQRSITAMDKATQLNPNDLETWLRRGSLYVQLYAADVGGTTKKETRRAFVKARNIAPDHPLPPLLTGQAEFVLDPSDITEVARLLRSAASRRAESKEAKYLFTKFFRETNKQ